MPLIESDVLHDIKANRVIRVERSKIYDVLDAILRNKIEKLFGRGAVRINESDPFPILNVLYRHILEHRRFAHSGFADNVNVFAAIFRSYAEHLAFATRVSCRKICDPAIRIFRIRMHEISI